LRLELERENRGTDRMKGCGRRNLRAERFSEAPDGARMQLRHTGFVHAQLHPNLFHRHFAVVVQRDHPAFPRGQRFYRRPHAVSNLGAFEREIGALGFRRNHDRRQLRFVDVVAAGEWGGRFNRVDAYNRLAETLFVGSNRRRKIGERGLVTKLQTKPLARGLEFPAHALRTPRGHASLRSASIIAPRIRRSAKVSNLMPRPSSKRSAASIRPMTPSWTRSLRSIECGMVAAMRRANASTNGRPVSTRVFVSPLLSTLMVSRPRALGVWAHVQPA